jgi:hypothetical protein
MKRHTQNIHYDQCRQQSKIDLSFQFQFSSNPLLLRQSCNARRRAPLRLHRVQLSLIRSPQSLCVRLVRHRNLSRHQECDIGYISLAHLSTMTAIPTIPTITHRVSPLPRALFAVLRPNRLFSTCVTMVWGPTISASFVILEIPGVWLVAGEVDDACASHPEKFRHLLNPTVAGISHLTMHPHASPFLEKVWGDPEGAGLARVDLRYLVSFPDWSLPPFFLRPAQLWAGSDMKRIAQSGPLQAVNWGRFMVILLPTLTQEKLAKEGRRLSSEHTYFTPTFFFQSSKNSWRQPAEVSETIPN